MSVAEEIQPNGYYNQLKDRHLVVRRGWNDRIADELVDASREQDIVKRFPRDAHKRFASIEAANEWAKKDPLKVIYTLALGRSAQLAGLIWIGNPEEAMSNVTAERAFYLRMYEASQGRGAQELAIGFSRAALADYEQNYSDGDIGLKIDRDDPDRHIYDGLGFATVGGRLRPSDQYVQMVRPGVVSRVARTSRHR